MEKCQNDTTSTKINKFVPCFVTLGKIADVQTKQYETSESCGTYGGKREIQAEFYWGDLQEGRV